MCVCVCSCSQTKLREVCDIVFIVYMFDSVGGHSPLLLYSICRIDMEKHGHHTLAQIHFRPKTNGMESHWLLKADFRTF